MDRRLWYNSRLLPNSTAAPRKSLRAAAAPGRCGMSWSRRTLAWGLGLLLTGFAAPGPALALDEITVGIGGEARAEHGGYYEAVAYGIYRDKYDLEVTVRRVDPPVDPAGSLATRELDFSVGGNSFQQFGLAR